MAESDFSIQIQPRDLEVLRSLFESRILQPRHIAALHFAGKGEAAKQRLQKLKSAGLIRGRRPRVNEPSVLFLTRKAFALLESQGILAEYPPLGITAFEKRSQVAETTIRHELEVLDVKTAIVSAFRQKPNYSVEKFTTWPALSVFPVTLPRELSERIVRPDGFMRISETNGDEKSEYTLFLEVDRSNESQEVLGLKAACYAEYYRSGGFALRNGAKRTEYKEFPFRVLFVLPNFERRNNTAETLLRLRPPVLTQVYLSTFQEIKTDPLASIWIRPVDYRDALMGTGFATEHERTTWVYKRQVEREALVGKKVRRLGFFE